MSKLIDSLRRASEDLRAIGARTAVIGGLAVSVRTEPRTTRDADFAVAVVDDHHAESIVTALLRCGYHVAAGVERIATVGHLIALKLLARDDLRRPQDRVDLAALLRVANVADLESAKQAIALIHARGFSRGRDLVRALEDAARELGDSG